MIQFLIRRFLMRAVRRGLTSALRNALSGDRHADRAAAAGPPAKKKKRRRRPGERRGDEIVYPTDDYTEPMQPRR